LSHTIIKNNHLYNYSADIFADAFQNM